MTGQDAPATWTKTYTGATPAEAAQAFTTDAAKAAAQGYVAASQVWNGPSLTVIYHLRSAASEAPQVGGARQATGGTAAGPSSPPVGVTPKGTSRLRPLLAIIVIGLIAAAIFRTPSSSPTNAPGRTQAGGPAAAGAPAATAPRVEGAFGDGRHRVNADIQPGTYRTREPASACYWARLKGFGGGVDDILANDNTDGFAVVTIAANDAGFESNRCGSWSKDLSAVTTGGTIPPGTLIVGTDIQPGTYRATGEGCYWARLSGFGGGVETIVANDNVSGAAVVTIASSDKGFTSSRCGTWSK